MFDAADRNRWERTAWLTSAVVNAFRMDNSKPVEPNDCNPYYLMCSKRADALPYNPAVMQALQDNDVHKAMILAGG